MDQVKIGIVGFGNIGTGVFRLMEQNAEILTQKSGIEFSIKYVIDKDQAKLDFLKDKNIITGNDYRVILEDPEVDILVELAGGVDFPWKLYQETVQAGKSYVTANKALLSKKLHDMFRLARENERYIGFEASVGGGIPIIQTLRNSLVGNRIRSIEGIINGTTNYILTRMEEQDLDFETALVQAQDLGFAEADPTLDINGGDAASKIAILSAISFHQNITFDDVHVEGIENVKLSHVHDAQELGYSIKLIAMSRIDQNGEVEVRVHPALVSPKNPLSSIRNEYNAILVNSDYLGESMYYGKGAGPFPTASAVVSDIVEIGGKTIKKKEYNAYFFSLSEEKNTKPFSKIISRYYIRIMIKDVPGILAKIATVMGKHDISIASLNQKRSLEEFVPVIFTTQHATEKQFSEALKEIKNFDFVDNIVYYRIID